MIQLAFRGLSYVDLAGNGQGLHNQPAGLWPGTFRWRLLPGVSTQLLLCAAAICRHDCI